MDIRRVGLGLVVVAGFGLSAVAVAADGEGGLKLSAGQATFLKQEPILVTLAIQGNPSASLPAAPGGESASSALRFEVEPAVKPRPGAKPLPMEAKTATAQTRKYDLLEWFQFPESGTFTVRAVAEHAGNRLTSAPITVTLRTPGKGDPDADAVARIHHVPWSNYDTNAFCGDTFDVVKKWPESALAKYCHYWSGRYSQNQKDYDKAIASYQELLTKYPTFALAADARRGIEECREAQAKK